MVAVDGAGAMLLAPAPMPPLSALTDQLGAMHMAAGPNDFSRRGSMTTISDRTDDGAPTSETDDAYNCAAFDEQGQVVCMGAEALPRLIPRMTTFPKPVLRKSPPVPTSGDASPLSQSCSPAPGCAGSLSCGGSCSADADRSEFVQAFTLDNWGPAAFAKLAIAQANASPVAVEKQSPNAQMHPLHGASGALLLVSPISSCDSVATGSHLSSMAGSVCDGGPQSAASLFDEGDDTPFSEYAPAPLRALMPERRCRSVSFSAHNVTVATFPPAEYDRTAVDPCVLSFQERVEFLVWRDNMHREIALATGSLPGSVAASAVPTPAPGPMEIDDGAPSPRFGPLTAAAAALPPTPSGGRPPTLLSTLASSPFPHDKKENALAPSALCPPRPPSIAEAAEEASPDSLSGCSLPEEAPQPVSAVDPDEAALRQEPLQLMSTSVFHTRGVAQLLF